MTQIVVPVHVLALDVRSADLLDAGGTAISSASGNQFFYTPTAGTIAAKRDLSRVLFKFVADASGDTVVFAAGARPPSQRADLGTLSVVLAGSDVRYIVVEIGRFLQADGTVLIDCSDDGTTALAFELPAVT